ncbi:DNA recombination protein RmuC [Bryocella elongata]|uniref:DNA recombination protein RmuC n=1 Tax=Bryocella elongata TaxID=863522 RepID=A0A1H6AFQ9_9BACT|nr:DNA recombination protein RmuC [Bryocella elongata]SEG47599.1 DNA recombination protein RmuC [Bryocella elongata]
MLPILIALQIVTLVALIVLWIASRKPAANVADPRLESLLAADLPSRLTRLETQAGGTERALREELAQTRQEASGAAERARVAADKSSRELREELLGTVNTLGKTLASGLETFRGDNKTGSEALRQAVEAQLNTLTQRMNAFAADQAQSQTSGREALQQSLEALSTRQAGEQEKLRETVQQRLDKLNADNTAKLEEMRNTVDEKLQKTLHDRLTSSFGEVTDQLAKVHTGLGEMNTLSAGVNDLNRIFSNVKSRGGFAEVQLGKLLEQVLAPGQFLENARVKANSLEVVEYAVKFPGSTGADVLLPIDAKFPREDWERLETAYEHGEQAEIEQARKAFDNAIRTEGKRICSKYINEPVTTPYAIMFLPTEGLYAEVLRRDGLQAELHQQCRVMVAGPSNLYALLTSFQLGFRILNLQKKGNEVWNVLATAQKEFKNFEGLMDSMEKQVGTVQNTIQKLGVRTRAINRTLRDVSSESASGGADALPAAAQGNFDGLLPMLAANEEE